MTILNGAQRATAAKPDYTLRGAVALGHYTNNPAAVANTHSARAKAVVTAVYETSEGLAKALPAIDRHVDANLSAEGLEAERSERLAGLRQAVGDRFGLLRGHLEDAVAAAEAVAKPFRPVLDAESVAQLTRTDQAWNNLIKPQIDAGKPWGEIIPTLDVDGLLAVQRFAPTHEAGKRSRFDQGEVPGVLEGIARMSDRRLADASPTEEGRAALREAADVTKYAAAATTNMSMLERVTEARDLPAVALSVKRATFEAGAQPGATAAAA